MHPSNAELAYDSSYCNTIDFRVLLIIMIPIDLTVVGIVIEIREEHL